ncbi:HNH endonuclease [Methylobrevis pamukkalensis]|uniref:HNH endonuclease n=1 Tax=Methylobrevis pamukkalensis TaxID=1439726 RepID=UPI0009F562EE|nr:HNH endonuclease [Methylobrevis pamukkalensis]
MPRQAPRICGCGLKIAHGERCPCQRRQDDARRKRADAARPSSARRGYDSKWRTETATFLARPENRLCACGCGQAADMVDHVIAHKGDKRLFWSRANWQPMNRRCNSRKAAATEGGFGNPRM